MTRTALGKITKESSWLVQCSVSGLQSFASGSPVAIEKSGGVVLLVLCICKLATCQHNIWTPKIFRPPSKL